MNQEQYDRWKDFSIRMAKSCFHRHRRPYERDIIGMVEQFFDCFDQRHAVAIVDWDHSEAYPEGHPFHGREYHQSYCSCEGRHETGKPNPNCPECHGSGLHHAIFTAPLLCDMVTEFNEEWIPSYWRIPDEHFDDARDQWTGPAACCIRAGLGVAIEGGSGMGVLGFTVGDIRRMYPEGVPDWIARGFDSAEVVSVSRTIQGIGFVPEVVGSSPRFEEMADSDEIWL